MLNSACIFSKARFCDGRTGGRRKFSQTPRKKHNELQNAHRMSYNRRPTASDPSKCYRHEYASISATYNGSNKRPLADLTIDASTPG